ALPQLGVVLAEKLDGDEAVDRRVAGKVERAHTALADALEHLVAVDQVWRGQRHGDAGNLGIFWVVTRNILPHTGQYAAFLPLGCHGVRGPDVCAVDADWPGIRET